MAMSSVVLDRERDKFKETPSGNTSVRVSTEAGEPIEIDGSFSASSIKVTTLNVTDVETALPTTSLTGRKSISILNTDTAEILYIGPTGVTADSVVGTTSGDEIAPGNKFAIDIRDTTVIFGIAPTGKTIKVKVSEYA